MKIIDDTYNGAKYPIVERDYNAYYFPDNFNPDNLDQQSDGAMACQEQHCEIKVYDKANPK